MPRLDLGTTRTALRTALGRLDTWTLSTLNHQSPALNHRVRPPDPRPATTRRP